MSEKYNDHLKSVLTADARLIDEQGDLMLNKIKDFVNNLDETLLDMLLADDQSRDKFFIKIKEVFVFKQREFIFFLEQNSLDNSFTSYANRIGLTLNGKFLKDNTDVVLDFPYKDCVLEGEQKGQEEKVFSGLKYGNWNKTYLKDWLTDAGIRKHITFHCARHTYATLQISLGTDIYTVSKLLGHKNLSTTEIYAKVINEKKVVAANKIKINLWAWITIL